MKIDPVRNGRTVRGVFFLLSPEESSQSPSGAFPEYENVGWNRTKSVLWLVFSILAALLIGQL
jgi:hypothetical protein